MLFLAIKFFFLAFGLLFPLFGFVYTDVLSRDILSQHVIGCTAVHRVAWFLKSKLLQFGMLTFFKDF